MRLMSSGRLARSCAGETYDRADRNPGSDESSDFEHDGANPALLRRRDRDSGGLRRRDSADVRSLGGGRADRLLRRRRRLRIRSLGQRLAR